MNILKRAKSVNTKEKAISNDNFILGKDETLLPKFTRIFGTKYAVNVYYLRVQKPELNLTDSCINIYLPMSFRNRHNQDVLDVILLKMYTAIAEKEIENGHIKVNGLRADLGQKIIPGKDRVTYKGQPVEIKKNVSDKIEEAELDKKFSKAVILSRCICR